MRNLIIGFLLLFFCSAPAIPQTESDRKVVRWDINFTTGGVFGGPGNDMINVLINSGHDYNCNTKNQLPGVFGIYRAINNYLRLGLNINMFNQDLNSESDYKICSFKTTAISPLISYNYRNFVFFDAGPTVNAISYFHSTGSSLTDDDNYLNLGFTLKSFLEFPKTTRIHLRMEMQYCYGGKIDPHFNIESSIRQYVFTTIHADNLSMNYFYYGIGLGFRLYSKPDHVNKSLSTKPRRGFHNGLQNF
jgi:hypothetical protein